MELSDPDPANHLKYKVIEGSAIGKHARIFYAKIKTVVNLSGTRNLRIKTN